MQFQFRDSGQWMYLITIVAGTNNRLRMWSARQDNQEKCTDLFSAGVSNILAIWGKDGPNEMNKKSLQILYGQNGYFKKLMCYPGSAPLYFLSFTFFTFLSTFV